MAMNCSPKKMSLIIEVMALYEIVVSGIDPSPLESAEDLITFNLVQGQGLLGIIQVCKMKSSAKSPKLSLFMICRFICRCYTDVIQPDSMSLGFDH
jgi:hypothetical protein